MAWSVMHSPIKEGNLTFVTRSVSIIVWFFKDQLGQDNEGRMCVGIGGDSSVNPINQKLQIFSESTNKDSTDISSVVRCLGLVPVPKGE